MVINRERSFIHNADGERKECEFEVMDRDLTQKGFDVGRDA